MNEKVYMHALSSALDIDLQLNILFEILKDDALLSLRNQGKEESVGFAGLDYISLCDYEKRFLVPENKENFNSYYSYIRYGISLAFTKDKVDVIIPSQFNVKMPPFKYYKKIKELGNGKKRYSDFPDEVQVKDKLPLDNLEYLTFPTTTFINDSVFLSKNEKVKLLLEKIKNMKLLLEYFDKNRNIYDIDTQVLMDEEGIYKLIYK